MKKLEQEGDYVELGKGSCYHRFTLTPEDNIVIEEYFGYDFKRSHIHSRVSARAHWKAYIREGYVVTSYKIGEDSWTK